jgi:hypothetical protein
MTIALEKEFEWYLANQTALVEKYDGKVIAVKNGEVIGVGGEDVQVVTECVKTYELGTFLVQRVGPGDEHYTQRFHSRVTFR